MAALMQPTKSLIDAIAAHYHGEWGFAGSRAGMRAYQVAMVRRVLTQGQPSIFRHGGSFGADFEAHAMWREVCPESFADVWPADRKRAELFLGQARVKVEAIMPALDRNIEIAKRSAFLLAAPHKEHEDPKSETWHTIRAMLKLDKPTLIIWPESQRLTLYLEKRLYRMQLGESTEK